MKFCVIGVGRFGYSVATTLAERGLEVMAVDSSEALIASIKDLVTQAVCMTVTDEASLRTIGIDDMDTVIVAMGEHFDQSILITALLKKRLNIPKVITRSISAIHKDILMLIGADQVILPEQEIGARLADTLSSPFTDLMRLDGNFAISQLIAPRKYVGKTVEELMLYENYEVNCIAVKRDEIITSIDKSHIVAEDDKLIFSGSPEKLEQIAKL